MERNVTEREINLVDMFWAVCLKWRQMIVWAVIFALLAGGASYMKSARATKVLQESEEVNLDEMELTEDSEKSVKYYLAYEKMYNKQLFYNNNAPLMKLDANGFYKSTISYYVDNHFVVEYPIMSKVNNIDAILDLYRGELGSEAFAQKLYETLGIEKDDSVYNMDLIDCYNKYGETIAQKSGDGIMTISIYGANEEECRKVTELVKSTIESKKTDVEAKFGAHDVSLVEEVCHFTSDNEILNYQKENLDKLIAYTNSMQDMKSKFDEDALAYIDEYESQEAEILEGENTKETTGVETVVVTPTVSKKLVVFGFVGGAAIVFLIAVMMYLFNGKLRLEDDFERIYGIKLLGNIVSPKQNRKKWLGFIDAFFIKMRHLNKRYFEEDEALEMVCAGIRIAAKKAEIQKIYATGAVMGEEEQDVASKIAKALKNDGIEVITGKSVLYNAEALEGLAETGYTILIEQAGASLYTEIAEEIENCTHQDVKVLGTVVVA